MRVAIVGFGVQGRKRQRFAGSEAVAVVDSIAKDASYSTIEQLPLESYDAACVCTPDDSKFEIIQYLLSHGKHVLVEKPLLLTSDERYTALETLARKNKVALYVAYNHRFEPHIVNLKRAIESGELGDIYSVSLFYGNGTARDVQNSPWRDKGLGVLPDLASHMLDMLDFAFAALPESWERVAFDHFENAATDRFVIQARKQFPRFMLEGTLLSWRNTFRCDVTGSKGSAHIDCLCKWGPSSLALRKRVLPSGKPDEIVETITSADPTWELEYRYFQKLCANPTTDLNRDRSIGKIILSLGRES